MFRTCSTHGTIEKCIQSLVGNSEGKRPLERPRRRWEDNIKMDLRGVDYDAGHKRISNIHIIFVSYATLVLKK